jgi:hypothetical protein
MAEPWQRPQSGDEDVCDKVFGCVTVADPPPHVAGDGLIMLTIENAEGLAVMLGPFDQLPLPVHSRQFHRGSRKFQLHIAFLYNPAQTASIDHHPL